MFLRNVYHGVNKKVYLGIMCARRIDIATTYAIRKAVSMVSVKILSTLHQVGRHTWLQSALVAA